MTRRQRDTTISTAHVISGGSRGGPGPPLFSDETEAPTAEKKIFETGLPPPPLSQGLDDRSPLSGGLDPPLVIQVKLKVELILN